MLLKNNQYFIVQGYPTELLQGTMKGVPSMQIRLDFIYYIVQGYPTELLQVTMKGVPSMHICLDFAPELLSQPSLEKQVF